MARRTCACGCGEVLPSDARSNQKYFDAKHRKRVEMRRKRARERSGRTPRRHDAKPIDASVSFKESHESDDGRGSARRGPDYERFVRSGLAEQVRLGEITTGDAALVFSGEVDRDVTSQAVSRWKAAYLIDYADGVAQEDWEQDAEVTEALLSYEPFIEKFHPHALVPDFHLEWETEIDRVIGTGELLCLLAPQRHGKTEFLIHYCVRRIIDNPDIRILWVSRTADIAKESVGLIRQELEDQEFAEQILGPGQEFRPAHRSGKPWTDEKLTVETRTRKLKSPTIRAIGIGAAVSGRDADLIVIDDPQEREDFDGMSTAWTKQNKWFFTTLLARKMKHTGVALITSRRDVNDIPGQLIRKHSDDWRILTYQAHDKYCRIPEHQYAQHVDCTLWPDAPHIDFKFLMGQKRHDPDWYECNYQNNPQTSRTTYLTEEHVEKAKDHGRVAGQVPSGCRLIAGIDPGPSKPTVGVLWGFDGEKRHLIDVWEAGPNMIGLREILSGWADAYGLHEFVFEKNIGGEWFEDSEVKEIMRSRGLRRIDHYTDGTNRGSSQVGPVSMFQRLRSDPPTITIPWGDEETQHKMGRLVTQFTTFNPNYAGKHQDDDIVFAAWFPQSEMDLWEGDVQQAMVANFKQTSYVPSRTQYPMHTTFDPFDPDEAMAEYEMVRRRQGVAV